MGAYFAGRNELKADSFPNKVLKYLWDDAFKMNHDYIFIDSINSLECLIETYSKTSDDPLSSVLRKEVYDLMVSGNDLANVEKSTSNSVITREPEE